MSESQVTISVPTELQNLGNMVNTIVKSLHDGEGFMSVAASALPVLFKEGAKLDDLKEEIKSPAAIVLAGIVLGQVVAIFVAKKAASYAAKKATKASEAAEPKQASEPSADPSTVELPPAQVLS